MDPRLVVVRDQFALRSLSNTALARIAPTLQEAQRQIIREIEQALEDRGEGDTSLAWFVRRRQDTFLTITTQLQAVAERLAAVLPPAQLEAFQQGMAAADAYLEGITAAPAAPPAPAGTLQQGGQIEAITEPTVGADSYEQLATRTQAAPRPYSAPTITEQQLQAVAEGRGFADFPGLPKSSAGIGQGADYTIQSATYRWANGQFDAIRQRLEIGFALGRSNSEILADVRDQLHGAGRAQMEALVRTSMAEASQAAHDVFVAANADVLGDRDGNRFVWDASNDGRLCPRCAPWDGQRFRDRDDAPPCPLHWNCRCRVLPVTAISDQLDPLPGSFLEGVPVEYETTKNGKKGRRLPPPEGYSGENAYRQPRKINGEWQWVRRRDMPEGATTAGHMLQRANDETAHAVLGNWDRVERFRELTRPGGRLQQDPQGAVIQLLRP